MSLESNETAPAPEEGAPSEVAQTIATPIADGTEPSDEVKEPQAEKTFTQAELNEIVQKQKAKAEARAERRASQAYREALDAVTRSQPVRQTQPTEPTREQFASDAEWIDAKVEHKLAQREAASKERESQTQAQKINQDAESIYAKAESIPGFDRESFDELPLTRTIAEALIKSQLAPQLMVHLTQHPEEAERISKLSDVRQAVEIGKLEAKLETSVKKSSVPRPIEPIGARGTTSPTLANADFAEYKKQRMSAGAKWAR